MRGYPFIILVIVSTLGLMHWLPVRFNVADVVNEKKLTPLEVLFQGNARFVNSASYTKLRENTSKGQHPLAVVVTCSDSRVSPELLFQQNLGKLFVIRTAGEMVDSLEIGSIEYAVEHLHAPLIIVLGHSNCGAVQAYLGHGEPEGNIKKIINMIDAEEEIKHLDTGKNANLQEYIEANVRHNTNTIYLTSEVIQHKFKNKEVQLVSAIYNLETGKVNILK
ncbi:MAG: carbonic anhydrase [Bacteroidia bacterium]